MFPMLDLDGFCCFIQELKKQNKIKSSNVLPIKTETYIHQIEKHKKYYYKKIKIKKGSKPNLIDPAQKEDQLYFKLGYFV